MSLTTTTTTATMTASTSTTPKTTKSPPDPITRALAPTRQALFHSIWSENWEEHSSITNDSNALNSKLNNLDLNSDLMKVWVSDVEIKEALGSWCESEKREREREREREGGDNGIGNGVTLNLAKRRVFRVVVDGEKDDDDNNNEKNRWDVDDENRKVAGITKANFTHAFAHMEVYHREEELSSILKRLSDMLGSSTSSPSPSSPHQDDQKQKQQKDTQHHNQEHHNQEHQHPPPENSTPKTAILTITAHNPITTILQSVLQKPSSSRHHRRSSTTSSQRNITPETLKTLAEQAGFDGNNVRVEEREMWVRGEELSRVRGEVQGVLDAAVGMQGDGQSWEAGFDAVWEEEVGGRGLRVGFWVLVGEV